MNFIPAIHVPHFSGSGRSNPVPLLPRFLPARRRGESLLVPVTANDFRELPAVTDYTGESRLKLKLIGLNTGSKKRFMDRFFEKGGVAAIEGLSSIFPKSIDFRRAILGIGHQLRDEPDFQAALQPPDYQEGPQDLLHLRAIADKNRTTTSVPHIIHPHTDLGVTDYGQAVDSAPYAVGIADLVIRGGKVLGPSGLIKDSAFNRYSGLDGKKASVFRVLGAVEDYNQLGWNGRLNLDNFPAGNLRDVRKNEIEQFGHILYPHNGCFYVGSNISRRDLNLKRWGHYSMSALAYEYASKKPPEVNDPTVFSPYTRFLMDDALSAERGWKMPYMLLQFNRPSDWTFRQRATPP